VNVIGTVNVIDIAIKLASVQVIAISTTDKVYKNENLGLAFTEDSPLEGMDPYSGSKVAQENVIFSYRNSAATAGKKLLTFRSGNVVGGADFSPYRLLPDYIRSMATDSILQIRNPQATRPWQHVLDPLLGYLCAMIQALDSKHESAYNFGPAEESLTVEELVNIVKRNFPGKFKVMSNFELKNKDLESKFLGLDSTLSNVGLGWYPVWNQENAIISTIEWWLDVIDKQSSGFEKCLSDIDHLLNIHSINLE
jgi:CDP-glucose 4,6-dehydratase